MNNRSCMQIFFLLFLVVMVFLSGCVETSTDDGEEGEVIVPFFVSLSDCGSFDMYELYEYGQMGKVEAVDIDDDGDIDIIGCGATAPLEHSTISIFINQGNNKYLKKDIYIFNHTYINDIISGDFDRDDSMDFICSFNEHHGTTFENLNGTLVLFLGTKSGEFKGPYLSYQQNGISGEINHINIHLVSFDIDGDLDLDLILGDNVGTLTVLINDGNAFFTEDRVLADLGCLSWGIVVVDLEDDNSSELIACSTKNESTNTGIFHSLRNISSEEINIEELDVDYQFEGTAVLSSFSSNGSTHILSGNIATLATHTFTDGEIVTTILYVSPVDESGWQNDFTSGKISTADLDGDGNVDFLCSGSNGKILMFIKNKPQLIVS